MLACLIAGLATAPAASPAKASPSWAQPQIKVMVARGLMARSVASFRPNDPLAPVTMAQLDARLVRVLDLSDDAALFYDAASAAGLRPPARFGTEVVARLLD